MSKDFLKSDRLRVLVNGIHAKSGGGVTYLSSILPFLARDEELEIHLFLHRDQFELFGTIDERVRIHLLEFNYQRYSDVFWEQFSLPILARVMNVDVTVSPANFGPLFAPRPIIMLRNSLAVAGRETRLIKRLYWAGLTLMTLISLLTCRKAIAVSEYAKRTLSFGIGRSDRHKVSVVHHGVRSIFHSNPEVSREDYLLAVSDIYVQKNLHTLIQAMTGIREKFPEVKLKIAGRAIDLDYQQELNEIIRANGLEGAVEFLGHMNPEELLTLYQKCRLFVFPSTVETFGNPLVEAMACGAPIASSGTAAMPEILGDAAIYFDPLDLEDIVQTILEALADDTLRRELSERATNRASRFSWSLAASKTAEIIKSAGAKRYQKRRSPAVSADGTATG